MQELMYLHTLSAFISDVSEKGGFNTKILAQMIVPLLYNIN